MWILEKEKNQLKIVQSRLHQLTIFRPLLKEDPVVNRLSVFLNIVENTTASQPQKQELYCEFVEQLYAKGGDLGAYLLETVLNRETEILKRQVKGEPVLPEMQTALNSELETFTLLSIIAPKEMVDLLKEGQYLPLWKNTKADFVTEYKNRLAQASSRGYGIFSQYHMFRIGQDERIHPVVNPDPQKLEELTGYEGERKKVLVNTQALLNGDKANNILLYGDAGTGKSSTVKAIVNELYTKGVRLIEVQKNQLYKIPSLLDILAENPLKFIIFIDDLSFSSGDDDFRALKAILEGNIAVRPQNVVVYATSNRRHLLQQNFSARQGDAINLADTLQEESSLSDRFGLVITFLRPDKDLYLEIVENLAKEYGVKLPKQQLFTKAEAHALRYGGRSPRTAKQFIEYCKAEQSIQN